ncbi:MAG: carbohydrate kinase [Methylobacteriaceae bacterium]|nr:carbohydrate kinase [Methylobacteriaceae bacterium]
MTNVSTELLLSIDCGTQSVRALVFDLQGELVGRRQHVFDTYVTPRENWLEHDADEFWRATAAVCRALFEERPDLQARIKGVAVTTQRGSLVLVDEEGAPIRPFIIWLDQRRATRARKAQMWWRAAFALARVSDTIDYLSRQAELNWIAENEPDALKRAHKVLLVSGWLNYKLTGKFVDAVGSQVAYIPFDFKKQDWAARFDWKWKAIAARRDQMPDISPAGAVLGGLTAQAAAALGLAEGLPVIAAAADKACEIAGCGAMSPEIGALSYGTSATVAVTSPRYVEATPLIPPYPALQPGQYNLEVQIFRGFWMVNWFKQQFGHPETAAALSEGVPVEVLFDRLVAQIPPGSQGLMLQPYWTPGIRNPGLDARGAIIGFTDAHTRAHLYRAILEGLAYSLREGKERIEKRTKTPITSLRVSGGGSQSDVAMQATADIFNMPAARPHTFETSGLGAAIACSVGLGLHADFAAATAAMTRIGQTFEPDAARAALYERLYAGVYRKMYERLQPLYAELHAALDR